MAGDCNNVVAGIAHAGCPRKTEVRARQATEAVDRGQGWARGPRRPRGTWRARWALGAGVTLNPPARLAPSHPPARQRRGAGSGGRPGAAGFWPIQHVSGGVEVEVTSMAESIGRGAGAVEHRAAVRSRGPHRPAGPVAPVAPAGPAGPWRRCHPSAPQNPPRPPGQRPRSPGRTRLALGSGGASRALLVPADRCRALRAVRAGVLQHEHMGAVDRGVGPAAMDHPELSTGPPATAA